MLRHVSDEEEVQEIEESTSDDRTPACGIGDESEITVDNGKHIVLNSGGNSPHASPVQECSQHPPLTKKSW